MPDRKLTEEDGRRSLAEHIVEKANAARLKYGLYIDADVISRMLDDREVVRYPTGLRFDAEALQKGEFAFAQPLGSQPSEGFCLFVHPWFENQPEALPLLIAYHIPVINYGDTVVTREETELYGATLLGLEIEQYYQALCELADSIPSS